MLRYRALRSMQLISRVPRGQKVAFGRAFTATAQVLAKRKKKKATFDDGKVHVQLLMFETLDFLQLSCYYVLKSNVLADKAAALDMALQQIESAFGKGSIMKLGERVHTDVPVVSTGSLTLDVALGIGGLPRGRVVEIYGPESSGKTTLALHVVAQA